MLGLVQVNAHIEMNEETFFYFPQDAWPLSFSYNAAWKHITVTFFSWSASMDSSTNEWEFPNFYCFGCINILICYIFITGELKIFLISLVNELKFHFYPENSDSFSQIWTFSTYLFLTEIQFNFTECRDHMIDALF